MLDEPSAGQAGPLASPEAMPTHIVDALDYIQTIVWSFAIRNLPLQARISDHFGNGAAEHSFSCDHQHGDVADVAVVVLRHVDGHGRAVADGGDLDSRLRHDLVALERWLFLGRLQRGFDLFQAICVDAFLMNVVTSRHQRQSFANLSSFFLETDRSVGCRSVG